ncbi:MAG TPA: PAS domain S-box protein [Chryseolinea sp.]
MNSSLTTESIGFGIGLSRNSIINKFLLATMGFGLVTSSMTAWRDHIVGITVTNTWVNYLIIAIMAVTWLFRERIAYGYKAGVLFLVYLVTGIKALMLLGPYSYNAAIFLCFSSLIVAISVDLKWSILITVLISFLIPLRGYLHFSGIYEVDSKVTELLIAKSSWVHLFVGLMMTVSIIVVGVGQLRLELNKNFAMLEKSIADLKKVNTQLTNEIELKNSYQEDLLISSSKFRSLFEGSRDGVILLNSAAKVIEANQAICDLAGYSLEELRAAASADVLIGASFKKQMNETFDKQIQGEWMPVLTEISIVTKQGELVPVEFNSNVILTEEEVMIISTIRDISYRKQLENEKFNAVLVAEERERERFSKDLHDELGPAFSTLNLYLQTLNKKEPDADKKEILSKLSSIVDLAVKQVREISHNLSPYVLRDAGLVDAIATHLAKIKDNNALQFEFSQDLESNVKIPHNVDVVLYRVFLELLNNTIKHSGASKIKISLECSAQMISFFYIDNGRGFDPTHALENKTGIGLRNIESRVKSLGGKIDFRYDHKEMIIGITIPA